MSGVERVAEAAGFKIGEWVTFEASNGWKLRGKVTAKTEDPQGVTYTVEQFPDSMPFGVGPWSEEQA